MSLCDYALNVSVRIGVAYHALLFILKISIENCDCTLQMNSKVTHWSFLRFCREHVVRIKLMHQWPSYDIHKRRYGSLKDLVDRNMITEKTLLKFSKSYSSDGPQKVHFFHIAIHFLKLKTLYVFWRKHLNICKNINFV